MKIGKRYISLHKALVLLICFVVILAFSVTGLFISRQVTENTEQELAEKAMNVARMVGHSPLVIEALDNPDQKVGSVIQPFAADIRKQTDVRFIVVMDMNHIRYSHPDPEKIGKYFVGGDENRAIQGEEYTSIAEGTLGPSLRAFTPVRNNEGEQVGVVSVGLMMDSVNEAVQKSNQIIYFGVGVGILLGIIGAFILARKVKAILFGLEPFEIASLWEERNAMVASVREGILAVDHERKVVIANAQAIQMFEQAGITKDPIGTYIDEYFPTFRLKHVLDTGEAEYDEEQELNGLRLVVNRVPVTVDNRVVGAIATFRDKTELKQLAEQLTGVKLYAEALRVKTHEFMNKLHVILGLVHTGSYEKLASYIKQITNQYQTEVGAISRIVKDPVLAGFLLSKLSHARERGVNLNITDDSSLPHLSDPELIDEMITIIGNLIDNAIEAIEDEETKQINVSIDHTGQNIWFSVKDTGSGIPKDISHKVYEKGYSTKGEGRGYGLFLVKQSVERLHGVLSMTSESEGTRFTVELPYEEKDEQH